MSGSSLSDAGHLSSGGTIHDAMRFLQESGLGQTDDPVSLVVVVSPSHADNMAFISCFTGQSHIGSTASTSTVTEQVYLFGPYSMRQITSKWAVGDHFGAEDTKVIFASKTVPIDPELTPAVLQTDEVLFLGFPLVVLSQICIWIHPWNFLEATGFLSLVRRMLAVNSNRREHSEFAFIDILIHNVLFSEAINRADEICRDQNGDSISVSMYEELTETIRNEWGDDTRLARPESRECEHRWILPEFSNSRNPARNFQTQFPPFALLLLDILHNIQVQGVASGKDLFDTLGRLPSIMDRIDFEHVVLAVREHAFLLRIKRKTSLLIQKAKLGLEQYFGKLQNRMPNQLATPTMEDLDMDKFAREFIDEVMRRLFDPWTPQDMERYRHFVSAIRDAIIREGENMRQDYLEKLHRRQAQYLSQFFELWFSEFHAYPSLCFRLSHDKIRHEQSSIFLAVQSISSMRLLASLAKALRLPDHIVEIGRKIIDRHLKMLRSE